MSLIVGKFTKIIWTSNNNDTFIVNLKLAPNQEEAKKELSIDDNKNSINVIVRTSNFDLKLNYEIQIEKQPSLKYQYNYIVKDFKILYKNDEESAILFLSSKMFFGISERSAKKVINKIGLDILNDPQKYEEELKKIIGNKKTAVIIEGINKQNTFQQIYKKFIDFSLSISLLNTINEIILPNNLENFLSSEKLFHIINQLDVVDFLELNNIAKIFNKNYSARIRNKYLILWLTLNAENNGSSVNSINQIYNQTQSFFPKLEDKINKNEFVELLKELIKEQMIVVNPDKLNMSSAKTYLQEKFIVHRLNQIKNNQYNKKIADEELIFGTLDKNQINALKKSLNNNISIITGSPGTGKTLIISLLIKNLEKMKYKKIELLAPTGKAATQISHKTSKGARTIHSFLKYNKTDFDVNKENPSDVEVIIIDEFSMIDIKLFYSILIATPYLKKMILIGDKDQLPSIKCGYLLNDFINSQFIPTSFLNKIYRQNEESNIINNALRINDSQIPLFENSETALIEAYDEQEGFEKIKLFIQNYLNTHNNLSNQQILIPMYAGIAGIDNVNEMVQSLIYKDKPVLFNISTNKKNMSFYKKDKVIQLENDVEKNVFNGEIGYIDSVVLKKNKDEIEVEKVNIIFDNKIISYTISEFRSSVKLAYAISVHKFQGSECQDVLLILLNSHLQMITKKLFYTAYTRAIKSITLISNENVIKYAIENDNDSKRKSNICYFIDKIKNQ